MNLKKGFQNLGMVLAAAIILAVIMPLVMGVLHITLKIALSLAIIWLLYRGVIFVSDGFKDNIR